MQYLEYKLEAGPGGMYAPYWVDHGGHWYNPDNYTMVGATRDNQEFKIPDTVVKLTAAELETRQLAIHAAHPMTKDVPAGSGLGSVVMTDAEVRTAVQNWVTAHS